MLRRDLSIADQVCAVVRGCCYNTRQLRANRQLAREDPRYAAYASDIHVDYRNVLYVNSPAVAIRQLQTLTNTAARIVSGRDRFSRITDYVRDYLHWLAVPQRVTFKIATLVYKARRDLAPLT